MLVDEDDLEVLLRTEGIIQTGPWEMLEKVVYEPEMSLRVEILETGKSQVKYSSQL